MLITTLSLSQVDPAGTAAGLVSAHETAEDPHPQYTTAAEAIAAAPVQSVAGRTGEITVGIGDVVNLETSLSAKADLVAGKVPTSQIPAVALTEFMGEVGSQGEMLALTAEQGDWCIRTDLGQTFVCTSHGEDVFEISWTAIVSPPSPITSVNGQTGVVVLGYADVEACGASDARLSDARTPTSHAASHASAGSDPLTLAQSQITGLTDSLAARLAADSNLSDLASARIACANLRTWYTLGMSHVASTPLTGTTDETAIATITIPGNVLGPNGVIKVNVLATWTKSTNLKTVRVRYPGLGGESYYAPQISASTSGTTNGRTVLIRNRNDTSSQIGEARAAAVGGNQTDPVTSSADTTQDTELVISGQLASADDQITIESYIVQILYGA